jgi:hypothetical protein
MCSPQIVLVRFELKHETPKVVMRITLVLRNIIVQFIEQC